MTKSAQSFFITGTLIALSAFGHAQDVAVLAANYDIKFSIDNHEYRVHSRALVRSGNEIPSLRQNFKVGLRVSDTSPDNFLVQAIVYERNGDGWYQVTVPPPEFSGKLGTPTRYVWESGGMKLDIAINVGIYKQ